MFEVSTSESGTIQLQLSGANLMLAAGDVDRFVRNSPWVLASFRNASELETFIGRFQADFLPHLRRWCEQHHERVRACFVPFAREYLAIFMVTRSKTYDFEFSDPVADLEMDLFEKGWNTCVMQVPLASPESWKSLFDSSQAIQVYGDII
jgi:hypothetical protein